MAAEAGNCGAGAVDSGRSCAPEMARAGGGAVEEEEGVGRGALANKNCIYKNPCKNFLDFQKSLQELFGTLSVWLVSGSVWAFLRFSVILAFWAYFHFTSCLVVSGGIVDFLARIFRSRTKSCK